MSDEPGPIDPEGFARSVRALLAEDPRRYRLFGVYWYFVKALLKRYFTRDELYLLGSYEDPEIIAAMPPDVVTLPDLLAAAALEYRQNAAFNLARNAVEGDDGDTIILLDPDAE